MANKKRAPIDVATKLGEARDACTHDDYAGALRALLAVWSVVPDPGLANAIVKVGKRAEHGVQIPIDGTGEERQATWLQLAAEGDPAIRGRLLPTLTETGVAARVKAILAHPDPRTTDRIVLALVEERRSRAQFARHHKPLLLALAKCNDRRAVERVPSIRIRVMEALASNSVEGCKQRAIAEGALVKVEALPVHPPLSEEWRAIVVAIADAISVAPSTDDIATEAALRAAVYASPADDGPRQVYADWLLERGDPRGELIVLQLAPTHDYDHEFELVRKHGHAWLDPAIAPSVAAESLIDYRRGFPARVSFNREPTPQPAWSTLEEVWQWIPATDEHPLPILRVARSISFAQIAHLVKLTTKPPLEELLIRDDKHGDLDSLRLPELRELFLDVPAIGPEHAPAILAIGPLAKLHINTQFENVARWHAAIRSTSIAELVVRADSTNFTFTRDGETLSAIAINGNLRWSEGIIAIAAQLAELDHISSLSLDALAKVWTLGARRAMAAALSKHPSLRSDLRAFLGI